MTSEQQGSVSDIEALTERFQKLRDRKIESASNLKNAQQSLDKLKQQALEEYPEPVPVLKLHCQYF